MCVCVWASCTSGDLFGKPDQSSGDARPCGDFVAGPHWVRGFFFFSQIKDLADDL